MIAFEATLLIKPPPLAGVSDYLDIAVKSTLETVNCLHLAKEFGYITSDQEKTHYQDAEMPIKRIRAFKDSFKSHCHLLLAIS